MWNSLLQGAKLAKAEDYLNQHGKLGMLDGVAEDYIKVSRQKDKNRRKQKLTIVLVIGVVFLAALVAIFFGLEAHRQSNIGKLARRGSQYEINPPCGRSQPTHSSYSNSPEIVQPPSE